MAGPTPVSALIHAATMVTAGLYMVTRTNVIFQHSQTMLLVVALVGAATAIFAATIGITQNDIKKVLAYSTVSQLGFMFMACGVGAFVIGIFHVMTHAFFKALMFLGAGSVIHGMHHEQDMRRMGGLKKYMPYTYWTFFGRLARDLRHHSVQRFLVQRRNSLERSFDDAHSARLARLVGRHDRSHVHRVLHDAPDGDDVLGQRDDFSKQPAGGEADEAHASAYDKGLAQHDATRSAAGDRPRHDAGEHVGPVHEDVAHHVATHGHAHEDAVTDMARTCRTSRRRRCGCRWSCWQCWRRSADLSALDQHSSPITGTEHPGGKLNIVNWLNPIIWNPVTREFNTPEGGGSRSCRATADAATR